ncbi:hypothetical protein BDY21DRAFT_384141 [Lineolata rhizophorae]|uniref:Gag1-like clamp domain-containing protein n=1 Tax=Lineolata rhizophorae TaxID=578093 RepID=A0A6A6P9T4_9PEZI|nr:hypothetical protein BDY21DRAFT_384141 [Lineolata rhizophorae]
MATDTPSSTREVRRAAQRMLNERVRNDFEWDPETPEPGPLEGAVEYRERYYGTTSGPDSEPDVAEEPYKFESPDSIGNAMERRRKRRKRRRRKALEEEMTWNEGMECFVRRRDAWTSATRSPDPATPFLPNSSEETTTSDAHQNGSLGYSTPLVPLAPPILPPDNPIRAGISPRTYTDIYSKVVLSSRTPTVPINLADMTGALVHGWKEAGEWPPKPNPPDPLIGRRKRASGSHGGRTDGILANHPHVKKGVESMKRVLRLSGSSHGSGHGASGGTLAGENGA